MKYIFVAEFERVQFSQREILIAFGICVFWHPDIVSVTKISRCCYTILNKEFLIEGFCAEPLQKPKEKDALY